MKLFSLFFIVSSLYYIFNRERLIVRPSSRVYKNIFSVYFDIIYYVIELFYIFWIVGLMFFDFKFGLIFLTLTLFRWFLLKPNREKNDYAFNILKVLTLVSYYFIS
jgi:hypothetical protein